MMIMNFGATFVILGAVAPLSVAAWMNTRTIPVSTSRSISSCTTRTTLMTTLQMRTPMRTNADDESLPVDHQQTGRRAFFRHIGTFVGTTTTTVIAAPWMARADDDDDDTSSRTVVVTQQDPAPKMVIAESVTESNTVVATTTTTTATAATESTTTAPPPTQEVLVADAATVETPSSPLPSNSNKEDTMIEATLVENNNNQKAVEASLAELNAQLEESLDVVTVSTTTPQQQEESSAPSSTTPPPPIFTLASMDPNQIYKDLVAEREAVTSDVELDVFCKKLRRLIADDAAFAEGFGRYLDQLSTASA